MLSWNEINDLIDNVQNDIAIMENCKEEAIIVQSEELIDKWHTCLEPRFTYMLKALDKVFIDNRKTYDVGYRLENGEYIRIMNYTQPHLRTANIRQVNVGNLGIADNTIRNEERVRNTLKLIDEDVMNKIETHVLNVINAELNKRLEESRKSLEKTLDF